MIRTQQVIAYNIPQI